ncbi:bacillithiol biosynthesis cysteine-adding enzyme BshC [Candidatus Latescibacterota bacterium]
MIKTIDAATFFDVPPPCIPSDNQPPDFEGLVSRTLSLKPSKYPYSQVREILEREHLRLGTESTVLESVRSIDDETVYVIAGQQAGLFGGPLYTLYKAMHAIRLSSRLSETTGRKVIPLFWIASDDHDFDEVNSIGARTRDGSRTIVEYSPAQLLKNAPIGEIILDNGIDKALDALAKYMTQGERAENYLDLLKSSWQPGRSWSDAFAVYMLKLFSQYGLVMIDPHWKGMKELFKDIFIAELSDPSASRSLANEEAEKFETRKKRKKAIHKPEGSTNLFITVKGIRTPLFAAKNGFKAGQMMFPGQEIFDMAASDPERLSPAALLRPVCQDAILPVAALISGLGERLYLEQVKPLYTHFGVDGSLLWPRASFTIIDIRTQRNAYKEGIELPLLFEDMSRIHADLTGKAFPADVQSKLDSLAKSIETGFERLAPHIGAIDTTLGNSLERDKTRMIHILKGIRAKALRAHKASTTISEKRFASANYYLRPNGGPQERWFGADSILTFLGEEGFDQLLKATSPGEECHRIVFLE